jgi:acyl carrier protein
MMVTEAVTFWDSAPAALQQLVPFFPEVESAGHLSGLRLVFLSGDWIPVAMPDALRRTFSGVQVVSLGGATEATIWSNYYPIGRVEPDWPSIPYGKPIQNAKYYILDRHLEPCPIGVEGDLYIGGQCLASGYIGDEELTAQKFIANPFAAGEKIYRTGDVARFFADGNMEFLGRKDYQVKIRGFRVELGEIESQLSGFPLIGDCVVVDRVDGSGNKYLCGYYVLKDGAAEPDREALRSYLSRELPDYMIPSYFVCIAEVPLTANGKVDRKGLPEPGLVVESDYAAPQDEVQAKLVEIWSQVLGIEAGSIGIDADFFQLGGHSLNATMVVSKIHKALNTKVALAEVFNSPTIRELSGRIRLSAEDRHVSIEAVEEREYYELSSAQMRLYVLQQMDMENTGYNIQEAVELAGEVDVARLEEAFGRLIQRHESLRTCFEMVDGDPRQRVYRQVHFQVEYLDCGGGSDFALEWQEVSRDFIRPFDLSRAPLFRVGLFQLAGERHRLMVDMHHTISDGVSQAILIRDFLALYSGRELAAIRLHYKDYAQWRSRERQRQAVREQEAFWLAGFPGEIPVLNLPTDFPRPPVQSFAGDSLFFDMGQQVSEDLNRLASTEKATLFMVLLALYNVLLARICSQEDILVGTPVAGRWHVDMESIIGMFVNTLVLRNYPSAERTFRDFLSEVRQRTLEAFENQDYQFEELVEKVVKHRDTSRNPLFDAMFVLQNLEIGSPGAGGAEMAGLELAPYRYTPRVARFDMTLSAMEKAGRIFFKLEYCTKLFNRETIEQFIGYFKRIVSTVIAHPDRKIREIEIVSAEEKERILSAIDIRAEDVQADFDI